LQLADVADLKAQNYQADTKIINSRNFQLPLHPQYSARCCYAQGGLLVEMKCVRVEMRCCGDLFFVSKREKVSVCRMVVFALLSGCVERKI